MSPTVGQEINGRFKLLEQIGQGATGTIFRALQYSMEREVVLKVLRQSRMSETDVVERFFNEARAASKLRNPHIINLFDFGRTEDGYLYLVMELLRGTSLRTILSRQKNGLHPSRACRIMIQVCTALEEAHSMGVVHCDLKPENIQVEASDALGDFVKVLDFGIARIVGICQDGDAAENNSGQPLVISGSPSYMSPEQIRGEPIGHSADLYACGVVLYEMLSGAPPFVGSVHETMECHLSRQPPGLAKQPNVCIPPQLARVVHQCLEKETARRPESIRVLRETLRPYATLNNGRPEAAYPTTLDFFSGPDDQRDEDLATTGVDSSPSLTDYDHDPERTVVERVPGRSGVDLPGATFAPDPESEEEDAQETPTQVFAMADIEEEADAAMEVKTRRFVLLIEIVVLLALMVVLGLLYFGYFSD